MLGFVVCKKRLTFAELWSATCFFETVFFTFFSARITGEEPCFFECASKFRFCNDKRAADAVTDCACLSGVTAADDVDVNVVFTFGFSESERLTNDKLQSVKTEVFVQAAFVDDDFAAAVRDDSYPCDSFLRPVPQN